jgi:hypothetical protein
MVFITEAHKVMLFSLYRKVDDRDGREMLSLIHLPVAGLRHPAADVPHPAPSTIMARIRRRGTEEGWDGIEAVIVDMCGKQAKGR